MIARSKVGRNVRLSSDTGISLARHDGGHTDVVLIGITCHTDVVSEYSNGKISSTPATPVVALGGITHLVPRARCVPAPAIQTFLTVSIAQRHLVRLLRFALLCRGCVRGIACRYLLLSACVCPGASYLLVFSSSASFPEGYTAMCTVPNRKECVHHGARPLNDPGLNRGCKRKWRLGGCRRNWRISSSETGCV